MICKIFQNVYPSKLYYELTKCPIILKLPKREIALGETRNRQILFHHPANRKVETSMCSVTRCTNKICFGKEGQFSETSSATNQNRCSTVWPLRTKFRKHSMLYNTTTKFRCFYPLRLQKKNWMKTKICNFPRIKNNTRLPRRKRNLTKKTASVWENLNSTTLVPPIEKQSLWLQSTCFSVALQPQKITIMKSQQKGYWRFVESYISVAGKNNADTQFIPAIPQSIYKMRS